MTHLKSLVPLALILCVLLGIAGAACSDDDCSMTARPMLTCNIKQVVGDSTVTADTLASVTVLALGTDSVIVNAMSNAVSLSLPLRYLNNETSFILKYSEELTDTVTVSHTNTPYFLTMDCGYQMKQKVEQVRYTRHALDSISITNPETGIYGTENLQLFY